MKLSARDVASPSSSAASAASASARLRAIVLDAAAPILLRKRAMKLYIEAAHAEGLAAQAMETVLSVATRTGPAAADRRLRSAALRLLRDVVRARILPGAVNPSLGPQLASRVDATLATALASADPLVSAAAAGK